MANNSGGKSTKQLLKSDELLVVKLKLIHKDKLLFYEFGCLPTITCTTVLLAQLVKG